MKTVEWDYLFQNKKLARGVKNFALGISLVKAFPVVSGDAKIQRCRLKEMGVKRARVLAKKALSRREF